MQSNIAGVTLANNWKIVNNLFQNNGLDTDDHSSIFAWADNVLVSGNTFTADTMYPNGVDGHGGTFVAYEVHGANQRFVNNMVSNYYQGMWVAGNLTSDADNVVISGNTFSPIKFAAIDFYRNSVSESSINKIIIDGNTIGLDDTTTGVSEPDLKVAIQINTPYLVSNVQISNNICSKVGSTKASAFANIGTYGAVANQKHTGIVVKNNYALGFVLGVALTTTATNGLGYVEVSGNSFVNFTPQGTFTTPQGVSTSGASAIDCLTLKNNSYIDTQLVSTFQYGTYLSGTATTLYVQNETYSNMSVAGYYEVAFTVTNRLGTFSKRSFTPVWKSGGLAVTIGNGSVQGTYTINDSQVTINAVLTVGSTTSFTSGNLSLDLPFTSAQSGLAFMGSWRIFDSSAVQFVFGTSEIDGTGAQATLQVSGGTFATNTSPVSLATGDEIVLQITYNR
jgi:hypothetical protein